MTRSTYIFTLDDVSAKDEKSIETLFSLGNGHFGIRATSPTKETNGTIVNGFYETGKITYGEKAYGYANNSQTIIGLPSLRNLAIKDTGSEEFRATKILKQELDLKKGELKSQYLLQNNSGKKLILTLYEIVAQKNTNCVSFYYEIESVDYDGKLTISKNLNIVEDKIDSDDPRKTHTIYTVSLSKQSKNGIRYYDFYAQNSKLSILITTSAPELRSFDIKPSDKVEFENNFFISSIQRNKSDDFQPGKILSFKDASADAYEFWKHVWDTSAVKIEGNLKLTRDLSYNIFQLNCSAGRDGFTNIASKGVSGTGYEGHYFWDTEMYMLPYFVLTNPDEGKKLLEYRYNILPYAEKRAEELGLHNCALFAWRTINGEETSAYFPASTAQYHINADISFAVWRYYEASNDVEFLYQKGFRIILETARFWQQLGSWFSKGNKKYFGFFDVTGPDEYTALVNNNYYTNLLAKFNLQLVKKTADILDKAGYSVTDMLAKDEIDHFEKIANNIYLPFNAKEQINEQNEDAFEKPIWPFDSTPKENYPLLLHYHPLTIYRYQVNKQADTLLADFLLPSTISKEQLLKEYKYYESITTHDSSLSRAIFCALAARLGLDDKAYSYFTNTATMDLIDLHGNVQDGLHLANLGGSWLALVEGFAGLTYIDGKLRVNNHLPKEWAGLSFRIRYQNRLLSFELKKDHVKINLLEGDPIHLLIDNKDVYVSK